MMNRPIPFASMMVCASLAVATAVSAQQAGGQQQGQSSQYQGVAQPPNDPITTSPDAQPTPAIPKPSPAKPATPAPAPQPQPSSAGPADYQAPEPAPDAGDQAMNKRLREADPDGDIVHPVHARPGELLEGVTIRVKLLDRISSAETEKNEPFRGKVASDVLQDGKVLIPAGAEIEGRVTAVSSGEHLGGHGSFRLKPEAVVLPDGTRYQLRAEVTGTPGSKTRVGSEGTINAGSRAHKDGIEYGTVVGAGLVTGAVVGGPVGAVAGGAIGAGVVTTHLLVDHPQATLEPGAVLLFTLTEPMNLTPASAN